MTENPQVDQVLELTVSAPPLGRGTDLNRQQPPVVQPRDDVLRGTRPTSHPLGALPRGISQMHMGGKQIAGGPHYYTHSTHAYPPPPGYLYSYGHHTYPYLSPQVAYTTPPGHIPTALGPPITRAVINSNPTNENIPGGQMMENPRQGQETRNIPVRDLNAAFAKTRTDTRRENRQEHSLRKRDASSSPSKESRTEESRGEGGRNRHLTTTRTKKGRRNVREDDSPVGRSPRRSASSSSSNETVTGRNQKISS